METIDPHKRLPPFKADQGKYLTMSMFVEHYSPTDILPIFTMKEFDHTYKGVVYPSFSRLFLEVGDPTGYLFAKKYLGSFKHWQELKKGKWFRDWLDDMLFELETSQKAMSLEKIREISTGDTSQAFLASKFLTKEGWEDTTSGTTKKSKGRGRPTNEEVTRETKIQAALVTKLDGALERLN